MLLAQTEVGEVREGGDGGGSSTMPQKRNPVGSMLARARAARVPALTRRARARSCRSTSVRPAPGTRSGRRSRARSLTGGAAAAIGRALDGLEVDADADARNLELTAA